jgi:hypothetical protein
MLVSETRSSEVFVVKRLTKQNDTVDLTRKRVGRV